MLYATPMVDAAVLAEIQSLRQRLGAEAGRARPWVGSLRRNARASTARSSVAIEGFEVTADAARAVLGGQPAENADQRALAGYAAAMEHVAALADDPWFSWSERLILDLHFEA